MTEDKSVESSCSKVQSFRKDHQMIQRCKGEARSLTSPLSIKAMLVGPMLSVIIVAHCNWTFIGMAKELSHISMWLTTA